MKTAWYATLVGVIVAAVVVVPFIGWERVPGDHEAGATWTPFMKRTWSTQLVFINPARQGLEVLPPEALDASVQHEFKRFCEERFKESSVTACYMRMRAQQI